MDLVAAVLVRQKDGLYLFVHGAKKQLELPSQPVTQDNGVLSTAGVLLEDVLCINAKLRSVIKVVQLHGTQGGSQLCIFLLAESSNTGVVSETPPKQVCQWLSSKELKEQKSSIDPLALTIVSHVEAKCSTFPLELLDSLDTSGTRVQPRYGTHSLERQMLDEAGYKQPELDQIAEVFNKVCGSPSALMTKSEFATIAEQYQVPPTLIDRYFRIMCAVDTIGMSLEELQLGLCALDPATPHGSVPGQIRCQFIFRFYNKSKSGSLSYSEFREMYKDIVTLKKGAQPENFDDVVIENWRSFGVSSKEGISLNKFLTVVGQLKFRGTSVLFRLPKSPICKGDGEQYDRSPCPSPVPMLAKDEKGDRASDEEMDTTEPLGSPETPRSDSGRFKSSVQKPAVVPFTLDEEAEGSYSEPEFTIATHFVKVRRSGALAEIATLWDLVGTGAMTGSVEQILEHHKPSFDRLPSLNAFDKSSKSNEMLSGLRYFEHILRDNGRGKPKEALSWGAIDMTSVARCFLAICSQAINVLSSEPRLLEVSSPCYVLGDLHGNFHDLVCFEKALWRMGAVLSPASFLFLGDYVDRGEFGFEVISYLFAQKLQVPSKFQLIRGNHEIRAVQENFTYKKECLQKFGPGLGEEVWEATNKVFDVMPIAAVIDNKVLFSGPEILIFCVHGGIPHPKLSGGLISSINDIPTSLPDPSEECELAWEIMWNDPLRKNVEEEECEDASLEPNENTDGFGFVENSSRGTGHMFSCTALESFLNQNNLSHVIRAHEVKQAGFQLQQNGRLLTVFSSSHYCGSSNEAACVLVDCYKIRIVRLDTRS